MANGDGLANWRQLCGVRNVPGQAGFLHQAGVQRAHDEIIQELIRMVRERIGPVASFKVATIVKRLPKTRSGKIVRGTIKKIADGVEYRIPPTIDDPAVLEEITESLASLGYPRRVS